MDLKIQNLFCFLKWLLNKLFKFFIISVVEIRCSDIFTFQELEYHDEISQNMEVAMKKSLMEGQGIVHRICILLMFRIFVFVLLIPKK